MLKPVRIMKIKNFRYRKVQIKMTRTEYEQDNGQVSDQAIKQFAKDNDLVMTNDINRAIYLLRDGSMIAGEYDEDPYADCRVGDHRCIMGLTSEGDDFYKSDSNQIKFWDKLHEKTQLVRLVPETNEALIIEGQKLTNKQKEMLAASDYQVDVY